MIGRLRRLAVPVLVLAGLGVLVLALRVEIAGLALPWLAKSRGVALAAQVVAIDHRRIELRRVNVDGLRAEAVGVRYGLAELLRGRVQSVRVQGLALDVDMSGPGSATAPGVALPADLAPGALPEVELVDAHLRVRLAAGEVTLTAQATLRQGDAGEQELAATFDAATPWLPLRGRLGLRFLGLQPLSLAFDAQSDAAGAIASGHVAVRMAALDSAPALSLDAALSLGPESTTALAPRGGITFDRLQLTQTATLRPRTPLVLAGAPLSALAGWLGDAEGETALRFALRALGREGQFRDVDATGAVSLAAGPDGLRMTLDDGFTLSAGSVDRAWLQRLAVPAQLERLLLAGPTLRIEAHRSGQPLLALRADGAGHRASVSAAVRASSGDSRLELEGQFSSPLAAADLAGALTALPAIDRGAGRFELALRELALPGSLRVRRARTAGEVSLNGGDLALSLRGESSASIELAPTVAAAAGSKPFVAALRGPIELRLTDLELARPSIDIRRSGGALRVALAHRLGARLPGGTRVEGLLDGVAELDGRLALGGFDVARLELATAGLDVGASTLSRLVLRGRAAGTAERLSGTLDGELEAAGFASSAFAADAFGARLALGVDLEAGRWRLSVRRPSTVRLDAPSLPGRASAAGVAVGLRRGTLVLAPGGGIELRDAAGDVAPVAIQLARGDDPPLALALDGATWSVAGTGNPATGGIGGTARLGVSRVSVPEPSIALEQVDLALALGTGGPRAELLSARLVGTGARSFPALGLSGTAESVESGYRFALSARGAGEQLMLRGEGEHAVATGNGRVTLSVAPVAFAPGRLQPRDLLPPLAVLERVSGQVEGQAELSWDETGVEAAGRFALAGIALDYGDTRIEGLDLQVALEQLFPPRSRERQLLRVARIDAGLPVTDLVAALTLLSSESGSPYVLVEQLSAKALGGRVLLAEARIDPAVARQRFALALDPVELAALTEVIGLDELQGRGRLSGRFPVQLEGDSVIIEGGRLEASEPGTVSFRSAPTRQTLAPGGETLALMLQALDDFHYDSLVMTVDKPAAGESKIVLRLKGNNPAVLDGQPFDLSINVAGDLTPLLSALAQSNRLSSDLLGRLWRAQR